MSWHSSQYSARPMYLCGWNQQCHGLSSCRPICRNVCLLLKSIIEGNIIPPRQNLHLRDISHGWWWREAAGRGAPRTPCHRPHSALSYYSKVRCVPRTLRTFQLGNDYVWVDDSLGAAETSATRTTAALARGPEPCPQHPMAAHKHLEAPRDGMALLAPQAICLPPALSHSLNKQIKINL